MVGGGWMVWGGRVGKWVVGWDVEVGDGGRVEGSVMVGGVGIGGGGVVGQGIVEKNVVVSDGGMMGVEGEGDEEGLKVWEGGVVVVGVGLWLDGIGKVLVRIVGEGVVLVGGGGVDG